jgi:hypothetical protein
MFSRRSLRLNKLAQGGVKPNQRAPGARQKQASRCNPSRAVPRTSEQRVLSFDAARRKRLVRPPGRFQPVASSGRPRKWLDLIAEGGKGNAQHPAALEVDDPKRPEGDDGVATGEALT